MDFRILGTTEVLDGARPIELPSGRGRALLAILTLHAGEPVAAERLIDELWGGDPPATAATVVHGLVSRLRRALEPGRPKVAPHRVLQTVEAGYRLAIDPDSVDANRFKRLLDEARGKALPIRAEKLSAALALWRGPALADFTYQPFAQRAIAALEELRVEAAEERFEAALQLGRAAELIAELKETIAAHPLRERLRGFLMTALYRAGRQTEALDAYREARGLLLEELGLEPSPALRELEIAILRQDPSLELGRGSEPMAASEGSSWLPRERRRVTVAVIDIAPPAEAGLDPEEVTDIGAEAARVATEVLERHGGRVERSLGDELIAFFGFPVAREDDALSAVRAVLGLRTALYSREGQARRKYRSRAGIDTGDIIVAGPGGALHDVISGPVVAAARSLAHVATDDVLIGPAARRLLRGTVIVKPADGAMAWRVLEVVLGASAIPRSLDAPMIGRQNELTQLRSAFRRALRSGSPVRVTVSGEAGIGKSRLAREVVASFGADAHAITLRCAPPGDSVGFHPVRQTVIEAAGVHGWRGVHALLETAADGKSAVGEIGAAIALRSPPATAEELLPPMRRLLERLARDHPLIVIFDDLHWADGGFLELVDRLERAITTPILLLSLTRPELDEDAIASSTRGAVRLEPLANFEIAELVIDRAGPVTQGSLHKIVELSQGNPLFAEQLLAALDEGDVETVPPSLVGLLSARLDRLGPGERNVLRCASIAGLDFDVDQLTALLPDDARPFVDRHIETLVRKRFIQRMGTGNLRFAHPLIQMSVYHSMTREDRAHLHQFFADRVERVRSNPTGALTDYRLHESLEHGTGPQPAAPTQTV